MSKATLPKTEGSKVEPQTEKTKKAQRRVKPLRYQLVEVLKDGDDGEIFVPLPVPKGTDTSSKTPIIRAVTAAAAKGDERYDGKKITVIAYPEPQILKAEPITVKRKVTFDL